MGEILIHAGMPKTGSTSIQVWLRANADHLRLRHGLSFLQFDVEIAPDGAGSYAEHVRDATSFLWYYNALRMQRASTTERTALVEAFVDAVDRLATDLGAVLLTQEGFATLFIAPDEPFLHGLDELTRRHSVRVAYYVRPQHTALEARWCQWGYRSELAPSAWVRDQAPDLRYAETVEAVRELAPRVQFEARPYRDDLLEGGDVVADFARAFLRIDEPAVSTTRENDTLQLDLAILLRGAPSELLSDTGGPIDTGASQLALARLGRSWEIPLSANARRSREILHRYAYAEFGAANASLATELGWADRTLVAPPGDSVAVGDLEELDDLWAPSAQLARAYLYAALRQLTSGPGG